MDWQLPGAAQSVTTCRRSNAALHCVPGNTLRDAQIWSRMLHIALAASGFSCPRPENTSRHSGVWTATQQ